MKGVGEQNAVLPHKLMLAITLAIRMFVAAAAAAVCVCSRRVCL